MSDYSDLPDNIKKAIEEMLEALSGMTPEQIFNMLSEMLGEAGITEMSELMDSELFKMRIDQYNDDLDVMKFVDELDEIIYDSDYFDRDEDVEPYYEICQLDELHGEIIIEMPGLAETDMIDWYEYDYEIFVHTVNAYQNYKIAIPIPEYYKIDEDNIDYRNGLLIMPFSIK